MLKPSTFGTRGWVWPACAALLLASNASLLWRMERARDRTQRDAQVVHPEALRAMLARPIQAAVGPPVTLGKWRSGYLVIFLCTPSDCQFCDEELPALNETAAKRPDFHLCGVMSYASGAEASQMSTYEGLRCPVLLDPDGRLLRSLGAPQTPWKIVVDLAKQRVILEDSASETFAKRTAFLARLQALPAR